MSENDACKIRLRCPNALFVPAQRGRQLVCQATAARIKQHKAFMYQRRQARVAGVVHGPWAHEYAPGLHTLLDGGHVMATETDLTFSDGTRRPNGGPAIHLTGARLSAAREFQAFDDAYDGKIGEGPIEDQRPKFVAAK